MNIKELKEFLNSLDEDSDNDEIKIVSYGYRSNFEYSVVDLNYVEIEDDSEDGFRYVLYLTEGNQEYLNKAMRNEY